MMLDLIFRRRARHPQPDAGRGVAQECTHETINLQ
jgi:hypothetical protein